MRSRSAAVRWLDCPVRYQHLSGLLRRSGRLHACGDVIRDRLRHYGVGIAFQTCPSMSATGSPAISAEDVQLTGPGPSF